MLCCMNGVLIDVVPEILALIPNETTYAIQKKKSFLVDATQPIIISWKSIEVIIYFIVREPTWEDYEVESILKRDLMV